MLLLLLLLLSFQPVLCPIMPQKECMRQKECNKTSAFTRMQQTECMLSRAAGCRPLRRWRLHDELPGRHYPILCFQDF